MAAVTQMCSQGHRSANTRQPSCKPECCGAMYQASKVLAVLQQQAGMSTASDAQQQGHLKKRLQCSCLWRRRLVLAVCCCERLDAARQPHLPTRLSAAALPAMTCSVCTVHQMHTTGTVNVCWGSLGFP